MSLTYSLNEKKNRRQPSCHVYTKKQYHLVRHIPASYCLPHCKANIIFEDNMFCSSIPSLNPNPYSAKERRGPAAHRYKVWRLRDSGTAITSQSDANLDHVLLGDSLEPSVLFAASPTIPVALEAFSLLSDIVSPMQSVQPIPHALSMESRLSVVWPVATHWQIHISFMQNCYHAIPQSMNDDHLTGDGSLDSLSAAQLRHLKSDIREAIRHTMQLKCHLVRQSDCAKLELCNEIEYKVNKAVGFALKTICSQSNVMAHSTKAKLNPTQARNHQPSLPVSSCHLSCHKGSFAWLSGSASVWRAAHECGFVSL
ncbi:hypothetical protein BDN67DRAFT_984220 [Paxillus ammoniavirescens]|nr:hypothetical protein BDN67DRAFT_984220 [Paxillus ammoniavirescens]